MIDHRLAICAALSVAAHYALARGLQQLPPRKEEPPPTIEVRVVEKPPPVEPPPEEPKPEEPKPKPPEPPKVIPHDIPKVHPVQTTAIAAAPKDSPAPDKTSVVTDSTDEPVYGYQMPSSASTTGPALPQGNTTKVPVGPGSAAPVKPLAEPVAAAEATKLPLPAANCFGKYTDEALKAGVEGTVILDVIVGEDGHVRDVVVQQKVASGLTEAAVAALKSCTFTPGERDGKRVPVRVRGFKVHFVLPGNE